MPAWTPDAACGLLAAGLLTLTVLLVRLRRAAAHHRDRATRLARRLRDWEEEVRHLVAVRLPGPEAPTAARERPESAPAAGTTPSVRTPPPGPPRPFVDTGPLDARLAGTGLAACLDSVLERFTAALGQAETRADRAARAVLAEATRALLDLADEQQAAIAAAQHRHDDPDVLGDLLAIDHANARIARRAGALAVLGGAAPERPRDRAVLTDVVRGAASRIRDYRRIRVGGDPDVTVTGPAVDPLVLAVAELLDNATLHSPPGTTVDVGVRAVPGGARVTVDDAGAGLDAEAAGHAAELLAGFQPADLTGLGEPPRFGFAVVAALAARHGLAVTVDNNSPHGGLRAVVLVPTPLLAPPATGRGDAGAAGTEEDAPGGLPRRRRRTRRAERDETSGRAAGGEGSGPGEAAADTAPVRDSGGDAVPVPDPGGAVGAGEESGRAVRVGDRAGAEREVRVGDVSVHGSAATVGARGESAGGDGEAGGEADGDVGAEVGADADAVRAAERNARRMNALAGGLRRGRAEAVTGPGAAPPPGSAAPAASASRSSAPGTSAPGSAASGPATPGTSGPGTSAVGTAAPGSAAPDAPAPGSAAPGSAAPDAPAPGSAASGSAAPGTPAPDAAASGAAAPGTPVPGTPHRATESAAEGGGGGTAGAPPGSVPGSGGAA
ncbi:ATP-binding protein [Streptomyces sp. NPDC054842]